MVESLETIEVADPNEMIPTIEQIMGALGAIIRVNSIFSLVKKIVITPAVIYLNCRAQQHLLQKAMITMQMISTPLLKPNWRKVVMIQTMELPTLMEL